MNIVELNQFLEQQRSKGSDSINIIQVEQHARYAYPVGTFILTLIGVSLSSRKVRGGTGLHIGIGIALCFSYILFIRFFEEFAKSGTLPPVDRRLDTERPLPLHRSLPLPQSTEMMIPATRRYCPPRCRSRRAHRRLPKPLVLWREAPLWLLGELAARPQASA